MANTCAICGATINVLQSQKLMDGNYICTKGCRAKGLKYYDYVHSDLDNVKDHIHQTEVGTKIWEDLMEPLKKRVIKIKRCSLSALFILHQV